MSGASSKPSAASPTTAQIATNLPPALRQYMELKARHPDCILMYRMGDFFELFFDDAVRAAPILEVVLTARHRGTENEVPMCGVPHHAVEGYVARLLRAGLRVAMCDQVEDPKTAKGLVKREITRILTPGTVSEPGLLEGREENLLATVAWSGDAGAAAFLDVSTGSFWVRRWRTALEAVDDLEVLRPREVLADEAGLPTELVAWLVRVNPCRTDLVGERRLGLEAAADSLRRHFAVVSLRGFGLVDGEPAVIAAGCALAYARETQLREVDHIRALTVRGREDALLLDPTTLTNLEIFRAARDGGKSATLLAALDRTASPGGGRLLRDWLRRPLREPAAIERRLDAVEELLDAPALRDEVRHRLGRVGDLERLATRAVLGNLGPREAATLRDSLVELPSLFAALGAGGQRSALLRDLAAADPLVDLATELARVLAEAPAATVTDGGVIASGVDADLDHYRSLTQDSKRHVLALEVAERQRTGIASLKIRYNRVFGYYIEITRANQDLVPPEYIRRQTLVGAERYVTPGLKVLEEQILAAEERQLAIEERIFGELRLAVAAAGDRLAALGGGVVATLDVLAAFADVAARHGYVRPRMLPAGETLHVVDGRHPVVERLVSGSFVPNDTELAADGAQIVILTGPNMGGKSTYLRQVALLVVMAQAGSFVPATRAEIAVCDRIFTRVGASDDLARGESTFMVEMIETANILHHATADSLVVLDEVGRGTATFDGLSLAWAILEHLAAGARPKTLFATHYHELTELADLLPGVVNRTMAVREWEEKIVFLRRVIPGAADKSYGLHVARLAGLPRSVIERASEVLHNLESQQYDGIGRPRLARGAAGEAGAPAPAASQMSLFTPPEEVVAGLLRDLDVERLTPLAALNLLHSLKSRLGG